MCLTFASCNNNAGGGGGSSESDNKITKSITVETKDGYAKICDASDFAKYSSISKITVDIVVTEWGTDSYQALNAGESWNSSCYLKESNDDFTHTWPSGATQFVITGASYISEFISKGMYIQSVAGFAGTATVTIN